MVIFFQLFDLIVKISNHTYPLSIFEFILTVLIAFCAFLAHLVQMVVMTSTASETFSNIFHFWNNQALFIFF